MHFTINLILVLTVPLALIVFGVIGLLRRPRLRPVMLFTRLELKGNLTFIRHIIKGTAKFENFLPLLIRGDNISSLYTEDATYEFASPTDEFRHKNYSGSEQSIKLEFDSTSDVLKVDYEFESNSLRTLEEVSDDIFSYASSFEPPTSYSRQNTMGVLQIVVSRKDREERHEVVIENSDEIYLIPMPVRSQIGTNSRLIHNPSVSHNLASSTTAESQSYSLMIGIVNGVISRAEGRVALGRSKWQISPEDKLSFRFKRENIESIEHEPQEPGTMKLPGHILILSRHDEEYQVQIEGEAKEVLLNGERLRETPFGLGLYWFIGALASGILGGVLTIYFAFVEKMLGQ